MLTYRPDGMSMWDTWCIEHDGRVHAYYLQRLSPNSTRSQADEDWIGHAVTSDLIHWEERGLAFPPGEPGSLDDMQPWTGCVYKCGDRFHMYYTMRSTRDGGAGQRIGLAVSSDLDHWERYPGNPVISPDERWYIGHGKPLKRGTVDCRDLVIVEHPEGSRWLGYYAARVPAGEMAESSVIAAVQSTDLIHWERLPPAFAPRKYACLEVPDVFPMAGRWYMTCLTGNTYGNRGIYSDPHLTNATIYAVSDRPEGPFAEIDGDNVLIGGNTTSGYSCRSVMFKGVRYLLYTEPSTISQTAFSTLSPPTLLRTTPDGRLRACYSERTQAWRKRPLVEAGALFQLGAQPHCHPAWALTAGKWELRSGAYHGSSRTGWQIADLIDSPLDFEAEAMVTLESGAACGLALRPNKELDFTGPAMVFGLDAVEQTVFAANLTDFTYAGKRSFAVETGRAYHVRVCVRRPRIEIFVDDVLVLQTAATFPDSPAPALGLFVDRGNAVIRDVQAYELSE